MDSPSLADEMLRMVNGLREMPRKPNVYPEYIMGARTLAAVNRERAANGLPLLNGTPIEGGSAMRVVAK